MNYRLNRGSICSGAECEYLPESLFDRIARDQCKRPMSDEQETIKTAFLRQRRNLIVGALVILLLETTVSPPDELHITGITLRITHTNYVIYWLWVFTAYWLIRFFQYLPPIEDITDAMKHQHMASLTRLLVHLANKHRFAKGGKKNDENYRYSLQQPDLFIARHSLSRLIVGFKSYSFRKLSDGSTGRMSINGGFPSVELRLFQSLYFNSVAALDTAIRTPLFTEYAVPILLFLGAAMSSAHRAL